MTDHLTDEAVKALAHKYRFAKDDNERTIAQTAEALLVARATDASAEMEKFSDEDLLLELRRRKRLARLQAEYIVEGWRREYNAVPPKEYILPQLMKQMAHEIGVHLSTGHTKVPGMKIEEGHFEIPERPRMGDYHTKDLRYFIPFNFVVEKP